MRTADDSKTGGWDVVVVGGGVIGLAVARELARAGARVVLVEGGEPGAEASRAAGGMLAPQSEADHEDEFFRFQCASRDAYPAFAEALGEETGHDVELDRTGTLYVGFTERDVEEIEGRYRWQTAAGLLVERLTSREARELEPVVSPRVRLALRFPSDWQVENRKLLAALRESAEKIYGVRLLAGTRVEGVRVGVKGVEGVETSRGFLAAGAVVLAAGAWTSHVPILSRDGKRLRAAHPRVVPVRGQMLCFVAQSSTAHSSVRHVIYSPRGYVVPRRDGRLLAGSTTEDAGFERVVTAGGVHSILSNTLEIAPAVGEFTLADSWAGLRPRADDALPVIGESEEVRGLFYATGHYRNGILLAPLTARVVSIMVTEGVGAPASLPFDVESYSPARFSSAHAISRQA